MADEYQGTTDDETTKVSAGVDPTNPAGTGSPSGTPAAGAAGGWQPSPVENIHAPAGGATAAASEAAAAAVAAAAAAQAAAEQASRAAAAAGAPSGAAPPPAQPPLAPPVQPQPPAPEGPSLASRAAEKTAEGAKIAADRASSAAGATVQALRETDVHEIARNTTSLIENTRPFFLTAFAIGFVFLAAVENHAAIGVTFGIGAVLCVLGAAYSREIDLLLTGRASERRGGSGD